MDDERQRAELEPLYHATRIVVADASAPHQRPLVDLADGDGEVVICLPAGVEVAHVVTAHNPMGRVLRALENAERNRQLEADLQHRGLRYLRVVGEARDRSWSEASFALLDVDPTVADELGASYDQLAIFELSADTRTVRWLR